VSAVALREEVEELYAEYAECLDGDELERWPALFTEDCLYRIVPRENHELGLPLAIVLCESRAMLCDRVDAIRKTAFFRPRRMRHLWSGIRLQTAPGDSEIRAQASFAVLETLAGQETRVFLAGRYLDRIVRDAGGLRFRERVCVFDSDVVPGSLVYPV
jgi:3-phenylpropionate/cinnamic acid dioxygenase small subunit